MATRNDASDLGFNLEDLSRILRRRLWWLVIPAVGGVVIALVLALALPARYEAASVIVVEPPAIPDELVQTTVVARTEARYGQLKLQILARDNLSGIIDEFHLYPQMNAPREEVVERMREDIFIEPLPPAILDPRKPATLESFRIAFQSKQRAIVADVANRLTRDFISAHITDREVQAKGTSEFIENELVKNRADLERLWIQITAFREKHQGELPDDLASNTRQLERSRADLGRVNADLETARGQVIRIRQQIDEFRAASSSEEQDPMRRKHMLELALNSHQAQGKTEKHPDVVHTKAEIQALERMIADSLETDSRPLSPLIGSLQRELRTHEVDATVLAGESKRLNVEIADYEARLANTPRRAAGLDRLEASALNLGEAIRGLQLKRVEAKMGHTIELAQKGEKFKVVEWAMQPDSPVSPNRPLWFVVGSALGMLLGLALMSARELTDGSFHSVLELQQAIQLPILASVPRIRLAAEIAVHRMRMRRLGISSAVILTLIVGGTLIFYLLSRSGDMSTAWNGLFGILELNVDV